MRSGSLAGCLILPWLALWLTGCAISPADAGLAERFPRPVLLSDVPFYPQEDHQCGPAAVATVLRHTGASVAMAELISNLYVPDRQGTLQAEILATLRRHERLPYLLRPRIDAVMTEAAAGKPVLVLLNLGLSWYPRWHYAVVVGFDNGEGTITLRSGREAARTLPLKTFRRTWARGGNWGVIALVPGELPAGAEELPYLEAASAFEAMGRSALAIDAYTGALNRWPTSVGAHMGLGNSHYAAGRLREAEEAYRGLLELRPEYGPALNNLAQALAGQGELAAAEIAAQRAVSVGGPRAAMYAATLAEIRESRRRFAAPEQ